MGPKHYPVSIFGPAAGPAGPILGTRFGFVPGSLFGFPFCFPFDIVLVPLLAPFSVEIHAPAPKAPGEFYDFGVPKRPNSIHCSTFHRPALS